MNGKFIKKTFYSLLYLAIYLFYILYFFYRLPERIEQKDNFSIFLRLVMIVAFAVQIPNHLRRIGIYWKRYNSLSKSIVRN